MIYWCVLVLIRGFVLFVLSRTARKVDGGDARFFLTGLTGWTRFFWDSFFGLRQWGLLAEEIAALHCVAFAMTLLP